MIFPSPFFAATHQFSWMLQLSTGPCAPLRLPHQTESVSKCAGHCIISSCPLIRILDRAGTVRLGRDSLALPGVALAIPVNRFADTIPIKVTRLLMKNMNHFNHSAGHYLKVEEANIYYEDTGLKDKPVVLLLHGSFQNMEDMNNFLPLLADDFRVIGIDSRGHGKSTLGQGELTYERLQKDAETLLKHLQVSNVTIIGFSDGGTVAYRLAASNSVNVDRLITIGATWQAEDARQTEELFLKITPESWKQKYPQTFEHYQQLNPEPDFETLTQSILHMWTDLSVTGYPDDLVDQIVCPTLLVRGDLDHLFSLESVTKLAARIKHATLLNIPFAGHVTYRDQWDVFQIIARRFLNKQ